MEEELQIRIHDGATSGDAPAREGRGEVKRPTLIYLPGLHGDWTLVGSFRRALAGRTTFVELTYPRSLTWSLDDYAGEIEHALERRGISRGWLLAESYGSQVGWQIVGRARFRAEGLILAGGFVHHPVRWGVRLAARLTRDISPGMMRRLLRLYARIFRLRYRRAPEVLSEMEVFLSRRTDPDRQAAKHRLDLIAGNDPDSIARACTLPVYSLTGFFDPIVPWFPVWRWLKRFCPALREQRVIWGADHTVLATAPERAADQVCSWITASRA